MKAKYKPTTPQQIVGYLVEEAGEVLAAAGKSLRWGLSSVNPELPPQEREKNAEWLLREVRDLKRACGLAERMLVAHESEDLDEFFDYDLESIAKRENEG